MKYDRNTNHGYYRKHKEKEAIALTNMSVDPNKRKSHLRNGRALLRLGLVVALTIMIMAAVLIGMRVVAHERAQNIHIATMSEG